MRIMLIELLFISFLSTISTAIVKAEVMFETSESIFVEQYITETINDSLYVSATILTNGDVSELESLGLNIITNRFNIITLKLPYDLIDSINQLNSVISIEFDTPLELTMSAAREWVDSERAIQTYDVDGSGVIIGIIDKYIEPAHPEFENSSGDTRVLYYWDRRIGGAPPQGYVIGTEYDSTQINSGALDGYHSQPYYGIDHGTVLAGVASGNGSQTGSGIPTGKYKGIAPGADLIFVGMEDLSGASTVITSIEYIYNKAQVLDKPLVINISLGFKNGPKDGSTLLDVYIDELLENHTGKGFSIVVAAGNDGYDPTNAEVIYHPDIYDKSKSHQKGVGPGTIIIVPGVDGDPGNTHQRIWLDVWYEANNPCSTYLVFLKNGNWEEIKYNIPPSEGGGTRPYGENEGIAFFGLVLPQGEGGALQLANDYYDSSHPDPYPNTTYKRITFTVSELSGSYIVNAPYYIHLEGCNSTGEWNAYLQQYTDSPTTLSLYDVNGTIHSPGTSKNVITVGSYNTTNEWTTFQNILVPTIYAPDYPWMKDGYNDRYNNQPISFFSSLGPTMDGRPKPEIYAPGAWIASTRSTHSALDYRNNSGKKWH